MCGAVDDDYVATRHQLGGFFGNRIKWNFTKFLIDAGGKPVKRFSPVTKPEAIEGKIREIGRAHV